MTPRTNRAQRLTMPLARDAIRDLAAEHGACIRPVQLRRTNLHTGQVDRRSSPAAPPSRRSAPPAPNEPRPCGRSNAARAGTWTPSPSTWLTAGR